MLVQVENVQEARPDSPILREEGRLENARGEDDLIIAFQYWFGRMLPDTTHLISRRVEVRVDS